MKETLEIEPLSDDGSIARLAAFVREVSDALMQATPLATLGVPPQPTASPIPPPFGSGPEAEVMRGRLCKRCAAGYLSRRRNMEGTCPNPECLNTRLGEFAECYAWVRSRHSAAPMRRRFRRVAVDLTRVFITPAPASDVVWVWLEVET